MPCLCSQTYYFDKKTHPPVGPEDDEHEVRPACIAEPCTTCRTADGPVSVLDVPRPSDRPCTLSPSTTPRPAFCEATVGANWYMDRSMFEGH
jgi:hypothetical protein